VTAPYCASRFLLVTLGMLTMLAWWPTVAAGSGTIRVALVESVRTVELQGSDIELRRLPDTAVATWRATVVRAMWNGSAIEIDGRKSPGFRLRSARPIRMNGRDYVGPIDLVQNGTGFAVVNELPLEEYLVGVLRGEASETWPAEALRAQAIVARTYAAHHRLLGPGRTFHIVASTANQMFAGRVPTASPLWAAVQETAGQILKLDGALYPAFYHTECGGHTEDPRLVFAARNMPALQAVVCPFSAGSPHFYWNLELSLSDLSDVVRRHGADVGRVTTVTVSERTASQRAVAVTLKGTRGAVRIRGHDFRRMIGYDTLKSTLFTVVTDSSTVRFSGRGYGHGVGLCQAGARGMAEQGYSARQILTFYYPGTTLGPLDER
jgi:stage II sporulation protein D